LKGAIIECISLMMFSVGKTRISKISDKFIELLVNIQNQGFLYEDTTKE